MGLMLFFAAINYFLSMFQPLFTPMMLELTRPDTLGVVFTVMGAGTLLGTLAMSIWGGPRKRVTGIIFPAVIVGLAISMLGFRPSLTLISIGGFIAMLFIPITNGSSQALWQSKVAPDVQGRVFAMRRMLASAASPLGILIAGPLADHVFEPLLMPQGAFATSVGKLVGVGEGRGTAFFLALIGLAIALSSLLAYAYKPLRNVERDLPDAIPDEGIGEMSAS